MAKRSKDEVLIMVIAVLMLCLAGVGLYEIVCDVGLAPLFFAK